MFRIPVRLVTVAPLVPYLAVSIGLFVFHSAWFALLSYHAAILLILTLEKEWGETRRLFHLDSLRLALAALAFGGLGGVLLFLLWPVLGISVNFSASLARLGLSGIGWIVFILYFSLVNPWLEELYWRGYLGSKQAWPVVQDGFFSGYHLIVLAAYISLPWLVVSFLLLAVAAWLWRQFVRLTGGYLLPVLSHMTADLTLMLVTYYYYTHLTLPI